MLLATILFGVTIVLEKAGLVVERLYLRMDEGETP